jgi:excinuclease ABC subunit B
MKDKKKTKFNLKSLFSPTGDQPKAIKNLSENLNTGIEDQILMGVTGSGKTMTMASVIEKTGRPALVISPNKTLCAQLYQEFKEFFPTSAVHYFVSYYDYYQPEAYIPHTDTYIEKDAKINQEIDKLRHAAVQDLLRREDVIITASVSCIYNLGSPEIYNKASLELKKGREIEREKLFLHLINLQYQRNDSELTPGSFRARGEIVDIFPSSGEEIIRIEIPKKRIEKITVSKNESSKKEEREKYIFFPAHFWTSPQENINLALENIRGELQERLKELKRKGKSLEAQRLREKTNHDIEMIEQTGSCHGIENYSRHLEFRSPNDPPFTLLDYFHFAKEKKGYPENITFIDESHITVPQLRAMYNTDKARKKILIEHGFRLPSALDNRPLNFDEFRERTNQSIFVSATPGDFEKQKIKGKDAFVEQIIRPTGLLEPEIEIRPTKNQVKDLLREIKEKTLKNQRTLVVTLTKRMAEELSEYLSEKGIKVQYLHSEIKTMERPKILKNLREGEYDAIVGINLLREGLDLPEVSLVAILDADKEGFLRNETTLTQTIGRAARNIEGKAILYADKKTESIKKTISEIKRRRKIQKEYNKKNNINPTPITKEIRNWSFSKKEEVVLTEFWALQDKKLLEKEMKEAAKNLNFERAAEIRDLIKKLKKN